MDVEFAVQYLVLAHSRVHAGLLDNVGNIALLQRAEQLRAAAGRRRQRRRRRLPRTAPRPAPGAPRRAADAVRPGRGGRAARRRARAVARGLRLDAALTAGRACLDRPGRRSLRRGGRRRCRASHRGALDWQPALRRRNPGAPSAPPASTTARCTWPPTWPARRWSPRSASRPACRARCVAAWACAWPLTQLGLLVRPDLLHYGGLSGVLHAGAAIVALHLVWRGARLRRLIGAAPRRRSRLQGPDRSAVGRAAARRDRLGLRHRAARACDRLVAGTLCALAAILLRGRPPTTRTDVRPQVPSRWRWPSARSSAAACSGA